MSKIPIASVLRAPSRTLNPQLLVSTSQSAVPSSYPLPAHDQHHHRRLTPSATKCLILSHVAQLFSRGERAGRFAVSKYSSISRYFERAWVAV